MLSYIVSEAGKKVFKGVRLVPEGSTKYLSKTLKTATGKPVRAVPDSLPILVDGEKCWGESRTKNGLKSSYFRKRATIAKENMFDCFVVFVQETINKSRGVGQQTAERITKTVREKDITKVLIVDKTKPLHGKLVEVAP